jgi:amino acid transporter
VGTEPKQLARRLGAFSATTIVVGTVIGSGIFVTPGRVAALALSPGPFLLAWVLAGIAALCMSLVYTELAPMFPKAGGGYEFIKNAFGEPIGFGYGWALIIGSYIPVIALLAMAFTNYLGYFVALSDVEGRLVAVALIVALAAVNVRGVKLGGLVQNIFTIGKLGALGLVIVAGLLAFKAVNLQPLVGSAGWDTTAAAAVPSVLAFGGYYTLAYMSEEVEDPKKNIPLALVAGMLIVIVVNLSLNFAAVGAVPIAELAKSDRAVAVVALRTIGGIGGAIVAVGAMISIFGSLNSSVMGLPRIAFAMARDKKLFGFFSKVHSKYETPYLSILFYTILAVGFVLTNTFFTLLLLGIFVSRLSEVLVTFSLMWLRRKMPSAERPVKMFGYPITAIIAAGLTLYLVANVAPAQMLQGTYLILTAVPAYIFFRYWSKRQSTKQQPTPS